ncbi:MAG: flavodoxin-dependent (E)-4-hydroxy-3-methylbut-2-enyl-diphosphate synthase, partial [Syntrophomonadaceae bacterium]|nr:flavodoxin-dependent (E)-4-hydroxy-3-methylbut-2-enyl-diphosphate synthase [Syntrophomonadaceae bacterium]
VNGPGEAREADLGLAAGRGAGLIFRQGEPRYKVKEGEMLSALLKEIKEMAANLDKGD